jgi:glycine hydroxymethyltransferase
VLLSNIAVSSVRCGGTTLQSSDRQGAFIFNPEPRRAGAGTVLYQQHLNSAAKSHMADFAGSLLPLWFTSISAEHQAVRTAAGLFDCTHMGVLEMTGSDAQQFLNQLTTNDVTRLEPGRAQYSYILDAAGNVLDDIIVYRRSQEGFLVVVNAVNEPKIKAYLQALQNNTVTVDIENASRKLPSDCRVDIALQGPASLSLLPELLEDKKSQNIVENLKSFCFVETSVGGIDYIISRTGYTGAKVGFELLIHPEDTPSIWQMLLTNGKRFGVVPCGLGARDSLRIEAGLPLYGHELAGQFNISPFEAGYPWAVKLDKEFFIGKAAMQKRAEHVEMLVSRIELPGVKGIRPARPDDAVVESDGRCVGSVLSCAKVGEKQIALAYVQKEIAQPDTEIGLYYLARNQSQLQKGRKQSVELSQMVEADITGKIVTRFAKF